MYTCVGAELMKLTHDMRMVNTHTKITGIVADSLFGHKTADGEVRGTEWLVTLHDSVAPCDRHVVYDPLMHVGLVDTLTQEVELFHALLIFYVVLDA